ncbi:unnamed protein product [Ceratitis capitata]|uniref:(Mediterranean fruit fly) hypothetical protein n=1 Tax=Ceratitis capitata TaxID=7213 RepID=A0A811UYN7_CERCA|nr:unnamed protein product [Ceratitis capitata]
MTEYKYIATARQWVQHNATLAMGDSDLVRQQELYTVNSSPLSDYCSVVAHSTVNIYRPLPVACCRLIGAC